MSGEASMKIEKKVTSFIMLIIIIGLVAVMPVCMVSAETNDACTATNSITQQNSNNLLSENAERAATKNPLGSGANITYAYVDLNQAGGNDTASWTGAKIHVVANITLTSEVNLEHADAKMEFYVFHLYSKQASIANLTHSIVVNSFLWSSRLGSPINRLGGNVVSFTDGTTFDADQIIGDNFGGGGQSFNSRNYPNRTHIVVGSGALITGLGEKQAKALVDLRGAQNLYIDVTRILGITCQENADPMVTYTLFSNEVLCHIELTKVGDRFEYGTYTGTEYNYPMVADPLPALVQNDMRYVYVLIIVLLLVCLFLVF